MAEDGRSVLLDAVDHWNSGDLDGYMDLYAERVVLHRVPHDLNGKEEVRTMYAGMWRVFQSSRLTLEDVIAEGDRVGCRYRFQARQRDGREVEAWGITILHFANGQCVERWDLEAGH